MNNRPVEGTSFFLRREFMRRGYAVTTFPGTKLLLVEKDGKFIYTSGSKTQTGNQMGFWISEKKHLTKAVLEHFKIPTAKGYKISRATCERVKFLQFPLVLKPIDLNAGRGVQIGVKSVAEVREYFETHPEFEEILAEEMLLGEDVRVLIVQGKFFAALKRKPAFVIGDGIHTVAQLVKIENQRRTKLIEDDAEQGTYTTDLSPILFDSDAIRVIMEDGYRPDSVLEDKFQLFVRRNANISMGGVGVDITDEVCSEIRSQCEEAARCLTMTFAGIDIMTSDISKPLSNADKSGIVEINASATVFVHILADEGTRRDPTTLMVDEVEKVFFPK